jgi:hypothetical protein
MLPSISVFRAVLTSMAGSDLVFLLEAVTLESRLDVRFMHKKIHDEKFTQELANGALTLNNG